MDFAIISFENMAKSKYEFRKFLHADSVLLLHIITNFNSLLACKPWLPVIHDVQDCSDYTSTSFSLQHPSLGHLLNISHFMFNAFNDLFFSFGKVILSNSFSPLLWPDVTFISSSSKITYIYSIAHYLHNVNFFYFP